MFALRALLTLRSNMMKHTTPQHAQHSHKQMAPLAEPSLSAAYASRLQPP
jgi:hypothetical protein